MAAFYRSPRGVGVQRFSRVFLVSDNSLPSKPLSAPDQDIPTPFPEGPMPNRGDPESPLPEGRPLRVRSARIGVILLSQRSDARS